VSAAAAVAAARRSTVSVDSLTQYTQHSIQSHCQQRYLSLIALSTDCVQCALSNATAAAAAGGGGQDDDDAQCSALTQSPIMQTPPVSQRC